ncbi:MAG: VCBS repeat-containing protein [Deltaproteobacteria bacterium]|nr:VCBS repeat-containing protein [Deltaproteobacteria bacterium]
MKKLVTMCAAMFSLVIAMPAFAGQLRVFVADMNAVGVSNKDEMKITLQTLLASRLNSEQIVSVASASEADVLVTGTYVSIGKVFSVDALAKTTGGKSLTRAFVQGDNQDELIPSIGQLATKLSADLAKLFAASSATSSSLTLGAPAAASPRNMDIIRTDQVRRTQTSEFIKPRDYERGSIGGWISKRLVGATNLMATGRTLPDGSREIFLAEDRRISYFRQGADMKLVTDIELRNTEKIVSIDTIETGNNLELYVSVMREEDLASMVFQVQGDKLVRLAENIPYFFRTISLLGSAKKLYAQGTGRDADFFGNVSEASRAGNSISLKNPIKMPRFGNIYTFNQFRDSAGELFTVIINPDNYLVVFDNQQNELWRSNDKFGGSELYFLREDLENVRTTGDKYRWVFMNQRIQVTSSGEVIVGKNDGFWILGNSRSYKKGAVHCLVWNGSSLEEKWRTRDTQNYMPDYFFDEGRNELLMLQTVQRPGISARGASSLAIKKVE